MNTSALPHLLLCLSALWLTACANWINKTGNVLDVEVVEFDPCQRHDEKSTPPDDAYWHLNEGVTKFKVHEKKNKSHGIKLVERVMEDQDIEVPDYLVFNKDKARLNSPVCDSQQSLRDVPFAFAMHEMKDPDDEHGEETPHGLLLVPAYIANSGPKAKKHQFYLLVYSFKANAVDCTEPDLERCTALSEIWNMPSSSTVEERRKAILDRIDLIRPITPRDGINIEYHNGVIHGNL